MPHADCFFAIGKTHKVCQDYARCSRKEDTRIQAVLADGCSTAPDTDIGARCLVLASDLPRFNDILMVADRGRQALFLHPLSLDATLLRLRAVEGRILVEVSGDGVVAMRRKDGLLESWHFEYPDGYPGYLSYAQDDARMEHFKAKHGLRKVKQYMGANCVSEVVEHIDHYDLVEHDPAGLVFTLDLDVNDYDFVAVFSDGVSSFQRETLPKRFEPVNVHEVLEQVMAIKGGVGEFVSRRCQKFLKGFCAENHWHHNDDFSMAAIWCGE